MVCLTWPHLANWREIYNAAVLLQRALGIISPAQQCLCSPSLNIWGALVGMNGGTGFHHKAVKGEPAGGHFNSSVNIIRSRLCQLSKQYIAETLKGSDGCFLERPSGFLRTPLMVPTGLGHLPVLILSGVSKVTMRRKTTEGDTSVRETEREFDVWRNDKSHWTVVTEVFKERNSCFSIHWGSSSDHGIPVSTVSLCNVTVVTRNKWSSSSSPTSFPFVLTSQRARRNIYYCFCRCDGYYLILT